MQEVAGRMKQYIHSNIHDALEMREVTAKFTTDIVTLCIYGVESGAFSGEHSEVRNVARDVMYPAWRSFFTLSFVPYFPMLANFLKMKLCPDKDANFLIKLLTDTLNYRKENNIKRQDFMDHIMFLRDKKGVSDVEITAHAFTFFFDGIETSSLTLSKLFYQLAKSKNHQEKLRQILLELRDEDGQFEYDSLTENHYLEQVIMGKVSNNNTFSTIN